MICHFKPSSEALLVFEVKNLSLKRCYISCFDNTEGKRRSEDCVKGAKRMFAVLKVCRLHFSPEMIRPCLQVDLETSLECD